MSSVDAVDDVDGEGLVPVAGAAVGTLHLAVAGEVVAAHAQRQLWRTGLNWLVSIV